MRLLKRILYVHDVTSDFALATLGLALELAKKNDGQVDVVDVFDTRPAWLASYSWIKLRAHLLEDAEKSLGEFIDSVNAGANLNIKIVEGRPHIEVIRLVIRNDYDHVIKPIGSNDLIDRLLGRLDMQLLRHCPCPVWLSKGEVCSKITAVLAAVDGEIYESEVAEDALNKKILELSFMLCTDSETKLHVGHVWNLPFASLYSHRRAGIPKEEIEALQHEEKRHHRNWLNRLMYRAKKWVGADLFGRVKPHTICRMEGRDAKFLS